MELLSSRKLRSNGLITLSSPVAEYTVLTEAVKEVKYLRSILAMLELLFYIHNYYSFILISYNTATFCFKSLIKYYTKV